MPRLPALDPKQAAGPAQELFAAVQKKLGRVPNLLRTMGNSPAVLKAYLDFSAALATASIPAPLREQIALAVAEANGCEYCLAAHSAIGRSLGLDDAAILASRRGEADDPRTAAAVAFARDLVETRGRVEDGDVEALREHGYGDAEIAEIVATVALNLFTNTFNHVAGTAVDFPAAPPLATASHTRRV